MISRILACLALLALPLLGEGLDEPNYRQFTNEDGKSISAVIIDKTDTTVTFLLENGRRTAPIEIGTLSEADQNYVKGWSKAEAIFLQKCRGLTIRQLLDLRGYESFPFRFENNSITVDGKLNDTKVAFTVDTGAGTTLLHDELVKRAGIKIEGPPDHKVLGVAGEADAWHIDIPKITLGESVFKNRRISTANMNEGMPPKMHRDDKALLGADFMSQLEAVISYPERRIFLRPDLSDEGVIEVDPTSEEATEEALTFRLFKTKDGKRYRGNVKSKTATSVTLALASGEERTVFINNFIPDDAEFIFGWSEAADLFLKHCRALTIEELLTLREYQSFEYERRGNHIFVDGTLNKKECTYMIDTGADSSLLHVKAAEEHGCEIGPMDKKVYGIGGNAPAAVTKIAELTLGEARLTNRKVLSTDLDRFERNIDWIGLFGADFMRELKAVITYKESRIFIRQD